MSEDVTPANDTQAAPIANEAPTIAASTPQVGMPTGMVFTLGIGLITVNGIASGKLTAAWNSIWNGDITVTKTELIELSGEILFVFICAFIAQTSPSASNLLFALFVGLWLVWSMKHTATLAAWQKTFIQSSGQKVSK